MSDHEQPYENKIVPTGDIIKHGYNAVPHHIDPPQPPPPANTGSEAGGNQGGGSSGGSDKS